MACWWLGEYQACPFLRVQDTAEIMDHSVELERQPKKPRAEVARDVVGVGRVRTPGLCQSEYWDIHAVDV